LFIHTSLNSPSFQTLPHVVLGRAGLKIPRSANYGFRARAPDLPSLKAQRVDQLSSRGVDLSLRYRRRDGGDPLDIGHNLLAIILQRWVVDFRAEWVLELVADRQNTEDDVRTRDGDSELEGQNQQVHPCDLTDYDRIGKRQRRYLNAFSRR
jgi:hypothetical protein